MHTHVKQSRGCAEHLAFIKAAGDIIEGTKQHFVQLN